MENKTAEEIFCKVYTEFYGEPIDKAEQITEHRFNGNELMEFCEFYASQQKPEIAWLSEEENIQFLKQFTEGEHRTFANNVINSYQSELKTRIHPSQELSEKDKEIESYMSLLDDASKIVVEKDKEIERLKDEKNEALRLLNDALKLIHSLPDLLHDSLGDHTAGNDYEITSLSGERYITHKWVGSGEPLKQWIKSEIDKSLNK